jgi:hypothetical protein
VLESLIRLHHQPHPLLLTAWTIAFLGQRQQGLQPRHVAATVRQLARLGTAPDSESLEAILSIFPSFQGVPAADLVYLLMDLVRLSHRPQPAVLEKIATALHETGLWLLETSLLVALAYSMAKLEHRPSDAFMRSFSNAVLERGLRDATAMELVALAECLAGFGYGPDPALFRALGDRCQSIGAWGFDRPLAKDLLRALEKLHCDDDQRVMALLREAAGEPMIIGVGKRKERDGGDQGVHPFPQRPKGLLGFILPRRQWRCLTPLSSACAGWDWEKGSTCSDMDLDSDMELDSDPCVSVVEPLPAPGSETPTVSRKISHLLSQLWALSVWGLFDRLLTVTPPRTPRECSIAS